MWGKHTGYDAAATWPLTGPMTRIRACEQIFPRLRGVGAEYDITIIGRRPYIAGRFNCGRVAVA
jgi:hypothetical protein